MAKKKERDSVSIVTVVLFGKSSGCDLKIGMAHTVGSVATVTTLGVGTRGGTNFTPNRILKQMLEINGTKATEVTQENGNEQNQR